MLLVAVFLNFSLLKVVARSLSSAIEEPISQLQDAVEKISIGEFDVDIEYDSYVGDFQSLITAMRKLKYQMSGTLNQIRSSSELAKPEEDLQ